MDLEHKTHILATRGFRPHEQLDEIIDHLQTKKRFQWSAYSWQTVGSVLVLAAEEIQEPVSLLGKRDIAKPLELLGGNTLSTLDTFARYHPERTGQDRIDFLLARSGIKVTPEDMIAKISSGGRIVWNRVIPDAISGVLQQAAQELETPVSMLDQPDFSTPLSLVKGHNINALYQYSNAHPERQGKNIMTFLLEKAGLLVNVEDVITQMKKGRKVYWERVPAELVKVLFELAGEELEKPPSMMTMEDTAKTPLAFLGDRSMSGIYKYYFDDPERVKDKEVMTYILDKVGIKSTADDVISYIAAQRDVRWDRIPMEEVGVIIKRAAQELGIPASMFNDRDFIKPLEMLRGRTLAGVRYHLDNSGQTKVADMFQKTGIVVTAEDVVEFSKVGGGVYWERVPWDQITKVIELAAEELGQSPSSIIRSIYLYQPLKLLEGHTLSGLYQYAAREAEKRGLDTVTYILEKTRLDITAEDVITHTRSGIYIDWSKVPKSQIKSILEQAADELGVSLANMDSVALDTPLELLNGRSLIGLYGYYGNHSDRKDKDTLPFIYDELGIKTKASDVIERMNAGNPVAWDRVPWAETQKILQLVATELDIPVSMLSEVDLFRTPIQALGGTSLGGLYDFVRINYEVGEKETSGFLLEKAGFVPVVEDVINAMKADRRIMWVRIPWEERAKLLQLAAQELQTSILVMGRSEFFQKFDLLGGKTLEGFYLNCLDHPDKGKDETVQAFIRRNIGNNFFISIGLADSAPKPIRANIRLQQVRRSFEKFLPQIDSKESLNYEDLQPWIKDIVSYYKNTTLGISEEEIKAELFIFLSEHVVLNELLENPNDFLSTLHKHLESVVRAESNAHYRDKSLETPIGEDHTLQDVLQASLDSDPAILFDQLSVTMPRTWGRLSEFQQTLVKNIAFYGSTLEEISLDTGKTVDEIQEYYDDALAILENIHEEGEA